MMCGMSRPEWEGATGKNGEEGERRYRRVLGTRLAVIAVGIVIQILMGFFVMVAKLTA